MGVCVCKGREGELRITRLAYSLKFFHTKVSYGV